MRSAPTCCVDELPRADVLVANIELAIVERLLGRVACSIAVTSGYLQSEVPTERGWARIDRVRARRLGG